MLFVKLDNIKVKKNNKWPIVYLISEKFYS